MAYSLNPRLFIENGPAVEAERARQLRSADGFRAWRKLHRDTRVELIDRALRAPANDSYPLPFEGPMKGYHHG